MGKRSKEEFLAALREDLRQLFPGMNITIGQPISHRIDHMLSGTRANIAVKIFGDDLYELGAGRAGPRRDGAVPGVVDLSVEQQTDIPILRFASTAPAIARHGLRIREVAEAVETAFEGGDVAGPRGAGAPSTSSSATTRSAR